MAMTVRQLACLGPHGFHRLAYADWAGPGEDAPVTLCLHGLTRCGRDFEALAERLQAAARVLAPDMPGRGASEWLTDPADYGYPVYTADVAALIARSGAETVDIVGTSMGGIIGMMLASLAGAPIRRLVLNDIGPFVPRAGLERVASYVGRDEQFADLAALEAYCRRTYADFGTLPDAEWERFARRSQRALPAGGLGLAYDPAIGLPFRQPLQDVDLWAFYDRIRCPVLVIRGARSGLLLSGTAEEMTRRGPKATLLTVADAGHAPALVAEDQLDAIAQFLASS